VEARQVPVVKAALASISKGGYPEAVARVFALLGARNGPFPLEQVRLRQELAEEFAEFLPDVARDHQRRLRGEQDIIVRYEPERALETLPELLAKPAERARLRSFLERLLADKRMAEYKPTEAQLAMLKKIRQHLAPSASARAGRARRNLRPKTARALQPA
jgi:hypothetical protein